MEKPKKPTGFSNNPLVFDNPMPCIRIFNDAYETINSLSDDEAGRLIKALILYNINGTESKLERVEEIAFKMLKAQINRDIQSRKEFLEKQRENGKKGGRPRKPNGFLENPENPTVFKKTQKSHNLNLSMNLNSNTLTGVGGQQPSTAHTQKKFSPPTVDEVREFCAERKNDIDAAYFIDYYTARGWKLTNGRTMADWKAAVRTWEKRDKEAGKKLGNRRDNPKNNYEQHPDSDTAEAMRNADAELMQEAQELT